MSDSILTEEAWAVFRPSSKEFLCGSPTNRRFGEFKDARIFRKRSAAINSSKSYYDKTEGLIVVPLSVSVDKKELFKILLSNNA